MQLISRLKKKFVDSRKIRVIKIIRVTKAFDFTRKLKPFHTCFTYFSLKNN